MTDTGSGGGGGGGALPTGCYKCGRPGHWSRDCPSSNPNPNPNSNSGSKPFNNFSKSGNYAASNGGSQLKPNASGSKPKKAPRTRPKLTPELLLSDQGLGYILRYFPRNFKYRGRGQEVNDLRNLLRMYAEWHEQFLPYFPFDQFIHKVEEVGSTRRVKTCIADLKDRVAKGGDPTKLKESATENEVPYDKEGTPFDKEDVMNEEEPTLNQEEFPLNEDDADVDELHGDMINEVYNNTVEETSISRQANTVSADVPQSDKSIDPSAQSSAVGGSSNPFQITEEQKSLMEAKRLKALERAAARSRLLPKS